MMDDVKTYGIKAKELRPCDFCEKPLGGVFKVIEIKQAIVDAQAARATMGLAMMLGNQQLAEIMSPDPDIVKVLDEESTNHRLFCCQNCYCDKFAYKGGEDE